MRLWFRMAAAILVMTAAPAQAAPANDFATFWPKFIAAVANDDQATLASMTRLGPGLGDDSATFAKFHAAHLGPAARRCLAKARPVRDVDPSSGGEYNYSAFCGQVIYGFSKTAGAWKLTDLGVND